MRKLNLCLDKELVSVSDESMVDGGMAPNVAIFTVAMLWLTGQPGFEPLSATEGDPDGPFGDPDNPTPGPDETT